MENDEGRPLPCHLGCRIGFNPLDPAEPTVNLSVEIEGRKPLVVQIDWQDALGVSCAIWDAFEEVEARRYSLTRKGWRKR